MGQELELDISDKSSVGLSPNTVLPSPQYVKKRSKKGKPTGRDGFITLKGEFEDIKLARFRSSSCKSLHSRPHGLDANVETRRGSVYQSSEEAKYVRRMGTDMGAEGRKKIEISRRSDTSFTGSIVDSLCGSDDEGSEQRSSRSRASMEPKTQDGYIEFCISSDVRRKKSAAVGGRDSVNLKFRSDKDSPLGKDRVHSLQKSVSAKVEVAHLLLSPSESDCSSRASPKIADAAIKKRMNQFSKSKSLRSPMSHKLETNEMANITRNRTYQKSLLRDLSNTANQSDIISEFIDREIQYSGIAASPVHLHGNLKVENKHGMLFFEFKVKCPEEVFVAKAWRVGNAFNWVYTFHSIDSRKKSSASGMETHDSDKDSMVARMLVSCNLCSEQETKVFENSMVTEFVLYDLTHPRHSVSHETKSCEQDASKTQKASRCGSKEKTSRPDEENLTRENKPPSRKIVIDRSNLHPSLSSKSYSSHEMAAIVLHIPFSRRESLKYRRGERIEEYSSITDLSMAVDQSRKSLHENVIQEQVKVVIPTGNHGLPNAESQGPSSLLDRLRQGGGCDCGGWDMACPLILLGNPSIQFSEDRPLMEEYQPLELFVQGAKERNPTFSMATVEDGLYAVDFHAQLSTLQAFSICVAILHGSSAFTGAGNKKHQQLSQCSSLKMLIEDDLEFYVKSATAVEEKTTTARTRKGIPRSYVLNPPFSPIARV